MDDDEKETRLRDQCAMLIMQTLIAEYGSYSATISGKPHDLDKTKRMARVAYEIADIMRKARLGAFE